MVLALTPTPPANAFVEEAAQDTPQPGFPLDVYFCETCAHVQLLDVVDPGELFENYVYVSGTSPTFVKHFDGYADDVIRRFEPPAGGLIVKAGEMVFTPPMVDHGMKFPEDTTFLTLSRNPRDQASYEADVVRVDMLDTEGLTSWKPED